MSDGKRPSQADLAALLQKREQLAFERTRYERRLEVLRTKISKLRVLETELDNEINRSRLRPSGGLEALDGSLNARSLATLRVWSSLHRVLSRCPTKDGCSTRDAHRAILEACPGAPDSTVRSYLHRFKKRGLVEQKANRWLLTERVRSKDGFGVGD